MKRKKKKDGVKPFSAGSSNSNLLELENGNENKGDQGSKDVPKIVIQPSLSDNDEEIEASNGLGENAAPIEQKKDNEEESGFEDEIDESNDGSSGDEGIKNKMFCFRLLEPPIIKFIIYNLSFGIHDNV